MRPSRVLTFNHAGTYIASAGQSGIVKYLKTNINNLTAWRAQRGQFSRQITHDLPLPVMALPWGSGLSRRVERSASLPATDGTSNASSGTQNGPPCVGQQGQFAQVLGSPNWNRAYDVASVRILHFLAVQGKHVDVMSP